ncbi:hypothetical protein HDU83_004991 [Entophlyctis luteolus]|nr:hypothetical protein HDU83_004991 [Entophlyctis luteolus]
MNRENVYFGGSLVGMDDFNVSEAWRRIYFHARTAANESYDIDDFHQMNLYARAHYISHKILYDAPKELQKQLARSTHRKNVNGMKVSLLEITRNLTNILYPWLNPTFSSIREMQKNLEVAKTGIVITCGDPHFYVTNHLIIALRRIFNITLPIEIYYAGTDDLQPARIDALSMLPNVRVVNIHDHFRQETSKGEAWSYKPFAILASSFRTVLFMDSDIAFLRSPMEILESSPRFHRNKLLYFRDRKLWDDSRDGNFLLHRMNPHLTKYARRGVYAQSVFGGVSGTTNEMESGFLVVDKGDTGILFSLLLAAKMNAKEERERVFYRACHGDKESFWFATEALRVPYEFNPSYGGSIGVRDGRSDSEVTWVCDGHLLHTNENNEPFWIHGGNVLGPGYQTNVPPNYVFVQLDWMAFHYDFELNDQVWHDGMNCIVQKNNKSRHTNMYEEDLIETYRLIFESEIDELGFIQR